MGVLARRAASLLAVVWLLMGSGAAVDAGQASAPQLTAAFLLNFAKFTTWPDNAFVGNEALVVCVVDQDRVADELTALARTARIGGRTVSVRRVPLRGGLTECQVVFGGDADDRRGSLLDATAGLPILTVGASSTFAERGGVANFFVDNGRMRFAVNPKAAERAQLRISSKLLSLARIVADAGAT